MSTKALEALLQKFQVVVFVGGFSQSGSTTCEGSHGTEDVDVLVLALHLCRISAAMSTDKGKLKNKSKNIKEIYHDIFTYIILHNIFDILYQPCFFFPKSGRTSWCDISEARPPVWRVWRPPRHGHCSC